MIIVAVDDRQINNKVIELDVQEYMDDKNIVDYKFIEVGSGQDAIELHENISPDIIFLDIMMPKISGLEVLEIIRSKNDLKQPLIVMVTALNEDEVRNEAAKLGADGYISKPFDNKEIIDVLDKYIEESGLDLCVEVEDDDFFDFDDESDAFFDFDDEEDSIGVQKEMMEEFNKSHKKVSSEEFLKDYETIEYMLEDLDEIEADVYEIIDELYDGNLEESIQNIDDTLYRYSHFLNSFLEFQELSTSINLLARILEKKDFSNVQEQKKAIVAEFIRSILNDLVSWKNHVFVEQDAVDVFYLNASLLNSCIQLENILKEI